jgi:hypothetical protein
MEASKEIASKEIGDWLAMEIKREVQPPHHEGGRLLGYYMQTTTSVEQKM